VVKKPNIKLHIDELVLHGFAPGDRYAIAAAVQRELARLVADQSTSADFTSVVEKHSNSYLLDVGAFHVEQNSRSNSMGNQIARAIHGGLTK
jgi:hypothetical protein